MIYLTVTSSPERLHNKCYFRGSVGFSCYIALLWGVGETRYVCVVGVE